MTDEQVATGMAGRYPAVCGHDVLVTSMLCPSGPRCPSCLAFLHALSASRPDDHRQVPSRRKPGVLARHLRRGPWSPV
ncbi:MAG: hypothetical protein ACRDRH_18815, partial [Pseudonocardia sp.]